MITQTISSTSSTFSVTTNRKKDVPFNFGAIDKLTYSQKCNILRYVYLGKDVCNMTFFEELVAKKIMERRAKEPNFLPKELEDI